MHVPVIFLSFSDSAIDPLALLEKERKMIAEYLIPLESQQLFQLHIEASAELSDIVQYFTIFKDRIELFHYGGHADEQSLFLEDGNADAKGLANLFAQQKNLKCIFLNGCSTREQVKYLLRKGVPAVIATRSPVSDPSAFEFAKVFYQAMSQQHTLKEAFSLAAANYQAANGVELSISDKEEQSESTAELPWGLYIKKSEKEVLSWKLPSKDNSSFIITGGQYTYDKSISPNAKLIESIANSIRPYSSEVKYLIDFSKSEGIAPKLKDLRAAVINAFPTPIGFHLRKVIIANEFNLGRLNKLANVYTVSTQLLAYILLAQLWDEKHTNPGLDITDSTRTVLQKFFDQKKSCFQHYDFIELIRVLGTFFHHNKIPYFVEEFEQLREEFRAKGDFHKACGAMAEIKQLLQTDAIAQADIESLCVQAEQHLCAIFDKIGFAAKYTLMTIKNIELIKIRHQQPKYKHNLVILDKLTASFGELDDTLTSKHFGEGESVLLLLDEKNITPNLNLSPFLIDENALKRQKNSKIFFWDCKKEQNHNYLLSDNLQDILDIEVEQLPQIKALLDQFFNDVLTDDDGVSIKN